MNDGRVPELIPAVTWLAETNVRADDRVALLASTSTEKAVVTALWSALTAVGADVTALTMVPNDVRNRPLRPVVAGQSSGLTSSSTVGIRRISTGNTRIHSEQRPTSESLRDDRRAHRRDGGGASRRSNGPADTPRRRVVRRSIDCGRRTPSHHAKRDGRT